MLIEGTRRQWIFLSYAPQRKMPPVIAVSLAQRNCRSSLDPHPPEVATDTRNAMIVISGADSRTAGRTLHSVVYFEHIPVYPEDSERIVRAFKRDVHTQR